MSPYQEKIIEDILLMIKDNLKIYYNSDENTLINFRKYTNDKYDEEYKSIPYEDLVFLCEESLAELVNYPFLYDFRSLE